MGLLSDLKKNTVTHRGEEKGQNNCTTHSKQLSPIQPADIHVLNIRQDDNKRLDETPKRKGQKMRELRTIDIHILDIITIYHPPISDLHFSTKKHLPYYPAAGSHLGPAFGYASRFPVGSYPAGVLERTASIDLF